MTAYADMPGLRWSTLKAALTSALHLRHRLDGAARTDTPSLRMGRLVDCAVLGDMAGVVTVPEQYVTASGALSTGKAAAEWVAAQPPSATIATVAEVLAACRIAAAVRQHPVAGEWLARTTLRHHVLTWDEQGVACKAEIDAVCGGDGLIWDLKTTRSPISVRSCLAAICAYVYHGQMGWYERGCQASGLDVRRIGWIFVESSAPYDVVAIEATDELIDEGRRLAEDALEVYLRGTRSGEWPGCAPAVVPGRLLWSRYGDHNPTDADSLGLEGVE